MRPHISLDVRVVAKSVTFYEKVFGLRPQMVHEGLRSFIAKRIDDHGHVDDILQEAAG